MTAAELAEALERAVPGAVVAHEDGIDMPTLTIAREHLLDACRELRDAHGRNFLSAVTAVDHLGYGEDVAGYYGTERGRDINLTGSWGAPETAPPPPTRFSVVYHLARVGDGRRPTASACRSSRRRRDACPASSRCGRRRTGTSASSTT